MRHGSLFSGIGGFDLAAEWMGWENVFHCEWNPFGQKILHHYWPNAIQYNDITKTDFSVHRGTIDILTGGFPCQPYSMAGKRLGKEDERHLWPHMLRAIREIQPTWVVGENVLGLVNWNGGLVFDEVQTDLEAEGYEVQPYVLSAASVNAPHRRERVWFVAYAKNIGSTICKLGKSEGEQQIQTGSNINGFKDLGDAADSQHTGLEGQHRQREGRSVNRRDTGVLTWAENKFNATDTDLHGCNQRNGEHEEQSGEGGLDAQRDVEQGVEHGDAADSESLRINREAKHENRDKQGRERGRCDADNFGEIQGRIAIADSASEPGQRVRLEQPEFSESEQGKFGGINSRVGSSKFTDWSNFPTQSPVCSGDDGIPTRLDGITFSKWRNESIKGYGNAVVPQVVHQIFKTISLYESTSHETNNPGVL